MREYETVFIFDAALEGDALDKQVETINSIISTHDGNVVLEQRWGRRRLAFPINKRTDGVYYYVRFEANNDLLSELDRLSKLNEAILRFLTIVLDHAYVQPVVAEAEGESEDGEAVAETAPAAENA